MRKEPITLAELTALREQIDELSYVRGNYGRKIRRFLEALLQEGITIRLQTTSLLLFAGAIHCAKGASDDYVTNVESEFHLVPAIDQVDRTNFTFHILLSAYRMPESMRERQRLLTEIEQYLTVLYQLLRWAPENRREALAGAYSDDLSDQEIDAVCDRLCDVFDRLLKRDFSVLDDQELPLQVIELADVLDSEVGRAFRLSRGITLEESSLKSHPLFASSSPPSLMELLKELQ